MPPTRARAGVPVSRRAVLLAAAVAPVAACGLLDPAGAQAQPTPPPDPDLHLRATAAAAENSLLAIYAATAAAHPELAEQLAGFTTRHDKHLAAITETVPRERTMPSTPATGAVPLVPDDRDDALVALRAAEADASAERLADCVAAADPELARVLAAVAACEGAHDRLLRGIG